MSILDVIGNTPLMEMTVEHENESWRFFAKLEFLNPAGSVKDRIAKYIVEQAEKRGELKSDSIIVEASSGNTGIALAMVAAIKGYKLIIIMPEDMSVERRKIITNFGAEICLTPAEEGFSGAREKAERMAKKDRRIFLPRQFQNPDDVECHYQTTGLEIIRQIGQKRIDAFVAGVGTGATLMGVGKKLKETNPDCQLVAVEPAEAPILSSDNQNEAQRFRSHKITGIGGGFIPELLDVNEISMVIAIKSDDAVKKARELARKYGMMVGISSGANVLATINLLKRLGKEKNIVTVLPDRSERYFSTDLYENKGEGIIRICKRNCENPFCEI